MNKKILTIAIASSIGAVAFSGSASANLATDASLKFDPMTTICKGAAKPNPGTPPDNCNYGTKLGGGSYFTMDANADGKQNFPGEFTGISSNNGLNVGTTQGTEGDMDNAWVFFSNAGNHTTVSDTNILSDDGAGNVTLDFSGWNVSWNGIPFINMGGGTADCGTTSDGICTGTNTQVDPPVTFDVGGTQDYGTGIASVTCLNTCAAGETYTLDYQAVVPFGDPSGFGGVNYQLHLEGVIGSAVPVPAAVWLFGSGLLGLVGVARRRKVA